VAVGALTEAVIGAKLLPPAARPEHLARPRLFERLASGLDARATVVVAGAGYGKSTLVARFLDASGIDGVWYALDPTDRDPWSFFRYLVHGIRARVPEFGLRTSGLWESLRYRDDQVDRFVDVFIRDAEESLAGRLVLVLDRVEHLEGDDAWSAALRRLLAYLPGSLHLILVGRSLPKLGLPGLAADGAVRTLHADELLFTPDETRTLLVERFGLDLAPATLAQVHERTRGWVTALQLLRQTARLSEKAAIPVDLLARTEAEVFEYFGEEVLAAEPAEARALLLASSVPATIDPEVAAEALERPSVRADLERMRERRLFLSRLDGPGNLLAFDPLFRDFLLGKLSAERGERGVEELARAFGLAYGRRGDDLQSLVYLRRARADEDVLELLRTRGRALLRAGSLDAVREAATAVAGSRRLPFLDDLLGEACRLRGDFAAAVRHFEAAVAGSAHAEALQGLAYSLLRMGETGRAEETAEKALALAGSDPGLSARILNTLSIVRYRTDRTDEAIAGWQEALARARQARDEHLTRMIAHNLGLPHAARGDLLRATECFRILTSDSSPRVGPEEGTAYLNLARIATLRGELAQAARLLDDAWEIQRKWGLRGLAADVLEAEANLLRESGDAAAGERYAAARAAYVELGQTEPLDSLAEEEALYLARRGEPDRAERAILEVLDRARRGGRSEAIASALLTLGEIRARSGSPANAVEPLKEARERFGALDRSYQTCASGLWLGLALERSGNAAGAREAEAPALRLAAELDYAALVRKVKAVAQPAPETAAPLPGRLRASSADLTVRLFGPVEVYRDEDRKIPASAWRLRRALRVFCYLAAARNHRATKSRIADAVWADARRPVVERNFHPTISFLRKALNHGHAVPKNFILCEGGAYALNPDYRYDVDADRFERGIGSARDHRSRGELEASLRSYDDAIALYRGPFLEEDDEEWIEAPQAHYESLLDAALRESAEAHVQLGRPEGSIAPLERLVERNPSDQGASIQLMRVLGSLGRKSAVEKEYRRLSAGGGVRLETAQAFHEILSRAGR
jgi:ATP/maltotriose-dependent transcriptional regulator MalT/DNA-binding SARP family transcriptional activator